VTYRRIHAWPNLPGTGPKEARETYELEFKGLDGITFHRDPEEHAKDIAALANLIGGVILIGIDETADIWGRARLPMKDAQSIADYFTETARDFVRPRVMIEALTVPSPDGCTGLVAVNVEPHPDQLVGSRRAKTPPESDDEA
jgi:predicted HTH transcriptional regulator